MPRLVTSQSGDQRSTIRLHKADPRWQHGLRNATLQVFETHKGLQGCGRARSVVQSQRSKHVRIVRGASMQHRTIISQSNCSHSVRTLSLRPRKPAPEQPRPPSGQMVNHDHHHDGVVIFVGRTRTYSPSLNTKTTRSNAAWAARCHVASRYLLKCSPAALREG